MLIKQNTRIIDAVKKIDKNIFKTCFVVDKNKKLLGSLTDGDIRRAIIKGIKTKKESIKNIYNKKPNYVFTKKIKSLKKYKKLSIKLLPVLDKNKKIIDYLEVDQKKETSTPVLVMAGGKGKRLLPLTIKTPKPLLKIKKKTLLAYVIENIKKSKLNKIVVSVNYKKNMIKKKLNFYKKKYQVKINYLDEKKPLGTAGAIKKYFFEQNENEIIVINCDSYTELNLEKILNYHLENKAFATIATKNINYSIPYGRIVLDKKFKIQKIEEKPKYQINFSAGIYVFNRLVQKFIKKNKRIDMNELIEKLIRNKKKIETFPIYENWSDMSLNSQIKR